MRVKDEGLRAIFERYGYDPDDPARGRDLPGNLLRTLASAPLVGSGERLDRRLPFPLPPSPREREALELAACGYSDKEIAEAQGVAIGTVKSRLKTVYRKLEANNRAHAVAIGIARRIIPR